MLWHNTYKHITIFKKQFQIGSHPGAEELALSEFMIELELWAHGAK